MKKTISFTAGDGTIYDIPEEQVEAFKADFPDARQSQSFRVGETDYAIPDDMVSDFRKDFPNATPMRVFQMDDGTMRRVASTGKIQRVNPDVFADREAMGGMTKGALEVQAQGGPVAAEDDDSFIGWLKNAWNTFSHSASGKIVAGDVDWKRKQVMRGVAEKDGGKEVSFMDLPDSELDDYMNSIAPNGYWSYLGNAIGLNIKNDIMSEWDKTQGSKIADPAERKAARVKYAMDLARMTFEQNEQEKELARAELEGRKKQWQAGMTSGLVEMAGYATPMMAPGVGIGLSATVEGTTRRNELLADKYEADEDGNLYRVAEGDSRDSALVKGGVGGLATAVVEKFGGKIVGGALSKIPGVKKVAGKLADTKLGHAVNKWMRTYDKYMGWSGVHSAPEEFAEEFVQGTIDAALGLNETEDEKKGSTALGRAGEFAKDFFSPKNLLDLGESMLLMQMIGGGGAYFADRYSGAKADKILKRIDGIDTDKLKDFTAEDKWRAVSAYYNGMGEEQVAEVVDGGAKALDGLLKKFEGDAVKTADGRAGFAEAHPEAAKAIRDARRKGEDVSRKMLRDIGISEAVLSDKAARNAFGDDLLADSRRAAAIKRAKMDGYQANTLAQTISEFVGDTPEAQRVFDRVVMKLKDATVLDDPTAREKLIGEAAEAVWNEDKAQRIGAARGRAKAAERADHDARLAEAERAQEEAAIRAENDAQERTNAEMLAREEGRYNEFMLAKEEARAKGGQNEAGANETQSQSEQAARVTPPAGEAARPLEAGKAPTEEGGKIAAPNTTTKDSTGTSTDAAKPSVMTYTSTPQTKGYAFQNSGQNEGVVGRKNEDMRGKVIRDRKPEHEKVNGAVHEGIIDNGNSWIVFREKNYGGVDYTGRNAWVSRIAEVKKDSGVKPEDVLSRPDMQLIDAELDAWERSGKPRSEFLSNGGWNVSSVSPKASSSRSPMQGVEAPTSASTETQVKYTPTTAEGVEGGFRAADAAAKKPFEERYREWAEEDAPAWAKDLSPEDKAEYERLLDDVTTDKGETDAERAEHVAQALAAIEAFEKAHTPKRGRGRPKKVAAETKVEAPKADAAAEPEAAKPDAPKGAKPDMKPVIAAMQKLGDLAMSDVGTLEKALRKAEARGQADRADNIRTFLDYKKSVGVNADPKSDKTQGGRYRASIESEKPLDDPKFRAWAKRRGAAPTQQKREEYDAAMVKQATKRLSRWIKGVKVKFVNAISDDDLKGDTRAQKIIDAEKHSRAALEEISSGKEFGVLTNEKFGEIKYPLGKTGKGGLGFLHIVEHRMNEGASLQDAIETAYRVGVAAEIGEESRTIYNTHHLDYDGVRAIIAVMPDGSKVITGYKIDADEAAAAIRRAATNKSRSHVSSNEVIGELQKILAQRADKVNSAFSNIRPLRDGKRIVGSYNLKTGEVTLAKGASVETVAHELGWHAAFDWAKRNAATNKRAKALYERMRSFADEAPDAVKAEIAALYGKLDADAFADEVGAALFVRGQAEQFAGVIDPMVDAPWYKKAWRTVVDIVKDWLSSRGMNRVDLDGVEEMSERRFSEFLATAMLSGKTLGERKGFSMDLDMSKSAKWERKLSDRFAPIKELMERVEGNNGEAYRMARTLEGMAQMGKNRAERAMKRVDKILVANDISPELLAQYMQAMAYEERNAKIEKRNRKKDGSGMTQKDAEDIFAEIDERGIREKCQEAADILWKIQDEGLQARVDAGLIDQETADKWRKEEPHHVPWRDAIDPDTGEWMGRNYMGPEFDTAEGRSTSATGDPITIMLQEYENAYARAAENALRQNLADIARLNTDVGTIYDSIQVDAKGHRSFIKFPAKGSGEKAKILAIPDGSKIESTKAGDGGMANILTYRENGETKYLALNGSLGEAIAAAVTGRSLLRPPAWLSKFMRGYAATATALSPTFAVRNTMADHFDIHGNMVKDFGLLKGEKMYAKMVAEEVKMSKELLQYVHTGDFAHDASGKATTAFGKLIEEYEAAGGLIGGLRTEGYDVIQKRIRADFRAGRNKLRSVGRELAAGWTDLQKMSELSTRLASFKVMKESGMSAKEAAMWSRESTVDFNKKGNWTPISNILWMFSNSALGSGVRQAKGLLTTKNGLQLATGLAAWGFIEGMLECAMNEGYDDEEEKRGSGTGADLNEYTRQNSAYLRFGDTVYRTNLHMGPYGIIKYAGNVAARVMSGRLTAEKAAKELGLTAAEVAAAFTGMGNVSADAILETGVPSASQWLVQMATGKDYAGRPLYRKKYDEAKSDSSHGRESTAAGYQWLAKKVNEITGGDEYSKGGIDIAPETVKLITETAGKNFVRDIVNIVQTSARTLSGENEPRNIPFVRDAVRKVDGNEDRYYEALRRYDADKLKLKDPNLKGEERRAFLNAHPWLKSNGKKGSTVVSTLETRIKDLMKKEENPNLSDERREELKALRRRLQARVIERMSAK